MTIARKPAVMGLIMGPMMMWMLHGALTGDGPSGAALVVFILAHVVFAALIFGAALFAARLSPRARLFVERLHRPSLAHFSTMIVSAVAVASFIHLFIHGVT